MSRLLLALALAAIVLLVGAFVPVQGKTLVERWNAAPSTSTFVEKGWNEVVAAWDGLWGGKPARKPSPAGGVSKPPASRPANPARTARAPERVTPEPEEHHTDADRTALDRIVAEHAADRPAGRPAPRR